MTPEKLEQAVIALIDDNVDGYSPEKYIDFLSALISTLKMREEAARDEMEA